MLHEKLEPASPVTAEWLLFELGLMHLSDGITGYQLNNILAVHNKTELACLSCGCQSTPEYLFDDPLFRSLGKFYPTSEPDGLKNLLCLVQAGRPQLLLKSEPSPRQGVRH